MSVSTRHLRPPTLPITPWPPLSRSSSVRCPTWKSIDRAPPVDEAPQSCPQRLPWATASAISVTRRKLQTPGNAEEHKRQETVPLVSILPMHGVRMPSSALKYSRNELGFAFAGDAGTCAFSSANCQELCVQMCLPCRRFFIFITPRSTGTHGWRASSPAPCSIDTCPYGRDSDDEAPSTLGRTRKSLRSYSGQRHPFPCGVFLTTSI